MLLFFGFEKQKTILKNNYHDVKKFNECYYIINRREKFYFIYLENKIIKEREKTIRHYRSLTFSLSKKKKKKKKKKEKIFFFF